MSFLKPFKAILFYLISACLLDVSVSMYSLHKHHETPLWKEGPKIEDYIHYIKTNDNTPLQHKFTKAFSNYENMDLCDMYTMGSNMMECTNTLYESGMYLSYAYWEHFCKYAKEYDIVRLKIYDVMTKKCNEDLKSVMDYCDVEIVKNDVIRKANDKASEIHEENNKANIQHLFKQSPRLVDRHKLEKLNPSIRNYYVNTVMKTPAYKKMEQNYAKPIHIHTLRNDIYTKKMEQNHAEFQDVHILRVLQYAFKNAVMHADWKGLGIDLGKSIFSKNIVGRANILRKFISGKYFATDAAKHATLRDVKRESLRLSRVFRK